MANIKDVACVAGVSVTTVARALKDNDIPYDENIVVCGNFLEKEAYNVAVKLLNDQPDITAIYCFSDMMALGAMNAIRDTIRML